ncbi:MULTISPECIES: 3-dehydroquinate synthase [unclassified Colwellia]|uniref:3-dehydroquinate synthase n=1 Tax=unclassified Colwellia TaxID=196834 RepID=UPI0015F513F6|nr:MULTISPECIES: 3-dehydroquinate synthase [unclassified Colwellia]MBA6354763.1 3-dehydroquinate synthase [Colwellia sp. BRX8-3]MBA6359975.1 3-dehydroquinate synthase [Colwellia sp. BRX8-6]MBA6366450.1 3-dehydroquinate synthase [Colwellia sp. BRX8-5]MBA6376187.1 3-dehydroquinate synthase [Colwellia sp. BRX8-2]
MTTLNVELGTRSYPIYIDSGLLTNNSLLTQHIRGKRVCIVSNNIVKPLYLATLKAKLSAFDIDEIILPDGEAQKSLANFDVIMSHLLANGHGRDSTLIALGGGVIGDITGFAAACYQRGINFIQVPTTLLSQVDSSVGGKTAVNHPLGKNMIGAFYQPKAVLIDIDSLSTLPIREFNAGMAEVIKYGILGDSDFFAWLESNIEKIKSADKNTLIEMVNTCCQCKADIVAADETESGVRALLNLGHTFGHAIEADQGYGNWLHGEAVATGMVLASKLSVAMNLLEASDLRRIETLIAAFDLPLTAPESMGFEEFICHMRRDKKNLAGVLRLIVPTAIGQSEMRDDISEEMLQQIL